MTDTRKDDGADPFSAQLIAAARIARDEHIAAGKPCCFLCRNKRLPNHPDHASHYVSCAWIENTPIPQHMNFGNTLPLMPFTAGQNCKAFIAAKEAGQ
jgi:hypothetical protein